MSVRSLLVAVLDRPGTRWMLTAIANSFTRRINGAPVLRVFYDRTVHAWGRVARGEVLIDGRRFSYFADHLTCPSDVSPWSATARTLWLQNAGDLAGRTIIDVGAEVGSDLHAFSRAVGPEGRVVAVEAHPATFALLQRTIDLSGLKNVTCVHAAAVDTPGMVWIDDTDNSLASTVGQRKSGSHGVQGVTLDDLADSLGLDSVALMKMNIEGSERSALTGARNLLARTHRAIIACHDFRAHRGEGEFYRTRSDVVRTLVECGFVVDPLKDDAVDYIRDHVSARRVASGIA